jgi:hypothetical protein
MEPRLVVPVPPRLPPLASWRRSLMNLRAADGNGLSDCCVGRRDLTSTSLTSISCSGLCSKPNLCSSSTSAQWYHALNKPDSLTLTSSVMTLDLL